VSQAHEFRACTRNREFDERNSMSVGLKARSEWSFV